MRARTILIVGSVFLLATGANADRARGARRGLVPPSVAEQLLMMDNPDTYARALGIDGLASERPAMRAEQTRRRSSVLAALPEGPAPRRSAKLADSAIAATALTEMRQSLLATRRDPKGLVAAYIAFPFSPAPSTRCLVKTSGDRGGTWSEPVALPGLTPLSNCDNPILAESDDGKWLYAAYQDIRGGRTDTTDGYIVETDTDIVVSRSSDGGRTWAAPAIALDGEPWAMIFTCPPDPSSFCSMTDAQPGFGYGRPSMAIEPSRRARRDTLARFGSRGCGSGRLYVTSTRSPVLNDDPTAIAFTRGSGGEWLAPELLDVGQTAGPQIIVQGPQIAAAAGGEVLVAWFHSGVDGAFNGGFEIRTRHSSDHGTKWAGTVTAAVDTDESDDDALGPLRFYKRWWRAMLPQLAMDRGGRAHIVYAHDPDPDPASAEEGDIRYITSAAPPYNEWSFPETVNDDGLARAQGFPSIVVRHRGRSSIIDVIWEDTRLSPEVTVPDFPYSSNLHYDVYHARKVPGQGAAWSPNQRVTDESSLQNTRTTGDRTALAASDSQLYAAWTDRREKTSVEDQETDVYGSQIPRGRSRRR